MQQKKYIRRCECDRYYCILQILELIDSLLLIKSKNFFRKCSKFKQVTTKSGRFNESDDDDVQLDIPISRFFFFVI